MNDILAALTHFQHFANSESASYLSAFFPSLITLFKFLDDGPIRTKVEEILTDLCYSGEEDFLNSIMILGADHPFVGVLRKNVSDYYIEKYELVLRVHNDYDCKFHAMSIQLIDGYMILGSGTLKHFSEYAYSSAIIHQDDTLKWERMVCANDRSAFETENDPNKQARLYIFSKLKAPTVMRKVLSSCKSLPEFLNTLKSVMIIRMIFTYSMSIFESTSTINE